MRSANGQRRPPYRHDSDAASDLMALKPRQLRCGVRAVRWHDDCMASWVGGGHFMRPTARLGSLLALMLLAGGCTHFMAGYRTSTVQGITLGMTTAGVANVAGQPQRREALATPGGPVEVWYYVIAGPGGALLEHPIVFANNQVVATGREAVQALLNAPAQQQTAQPQPGREAQEREEAARQIAKFYETYPILKGRE